MHLYSRIASIIFGIVMLVLAAAVTVETVVRKVFSVSLGGIDELSGYAIAIGAPLAFAVTLIEQSHIRINLFHMRMPFRIQAVLNALAALSLGALAIYLLIFTIDTVRDTQAYQSIAQTPWATPLIYPQSLWAVAVLAFAVPAVYLAARAMLLLFRGDWPVLNQRFGPETAADELKAELEDLSLR
jgi:TRAP-type C4-dicarboxylate transport system permease small subunit